MIRNFEDGQGQHAIAPMICLAYTVPLLEDVLRFEHLTGWKHLIAKWQEFFNPTREAHWLKSEAKAWCSVCRCRHGSIKSDIYGNMAPCQV